MNIPGIGTVQIITSLGGQQGTSNATQTLPPGLQNIQVINTGTCYIFILLENLKNYSIEIRNILFRLLASGQQLDTMDQKWQIIPIAGTVFQDGSSVTEYDSPGEEKPRTRRVACTCPNCCDGEKRYLSGNCYCSKFVRHVP